MQIQWSSLWPFPVAGLAYLVHLRYRRYSPRRLPNFTSLKLFEIYTTAAFMGYFQVQDRRLYKELQHDRDLFILEAYALTLRRELGADQELGWREDQRLQQDQTRNCKVIAMLIQVLGY